MRRTLQGEAPKSNVKIDEMGTFALINEDNEGSRIRVMMEGLEPPRRVKFKKTGKRSLDPAIIAVPQRVWIAKRSCLNCFRRKSD